MANQSFDAAARSRNSVAILDLRGDVNGRAEAVLADAYTRAVPGAPSSILLNFAEVGYIDSTGIALIVGLLARARNDGRRMGACGLSDHFREIFEITRLAEYITLYNDETAALAGL